MAENEALSASDRIMIGAICAECRGAYIMVSTPLWTSQDARYCGKACAARAYSRRKKARASGSCPVGCGNQLARPGAVVCGRCWLSAAGMCKGKRRLTEVRARAVQELRGRLAVWCRCCGWWHNTSHPVEEQDDLIYRVGQILEVMRQAKGQVWVNDLVESWDPAISDRKAWKARGV